MNTSSDRASLLKYTPRNRNPILDLITSEPESIAGEPEVRHVLRAHRDYFLANRIGVFDHEVAEIAARLAPTGTLVDLGCWTGVLASQVLECVTPKAYVGIDGGRWYVDLAREILPAWCQFRSFYLLPDSAVDLNRIDKLYFTLQDPLNTSGFYTRRAIDQDRLAAMPVGKAMRAVDFAAWLAQNHDLASLYLKIDIEGVDQDVVRSLVRTETLPQVLHFELLEKFMHNWSGTRELLATRYDFIDVPVRPNTTAIVIAIRKGESLRPASILWDKASRELSKLE